jgi:hypothetical protein
MTEINSKEIEKEIIEDLGRLEKYILEKDFNLARDYFRYSNRKIELIKNEEVEIKDYLKEIRRLKKKYNYHFSKYKSKFTEENISEMILYSENRIGSAIFGNFYDARVASFNSQYGLTRMRLRNAEDNIKKAEKMGFDTEKYTQELEKYQEKLEEDLRKYR